MYGVPSVGNGKNFFFRISDMDIIYFLILNICIKRPYFVDRDTPSYGIFEDNINTGRLSLGPK